MTSPQDLPAAARGELRAAGLTRLVTSPDDRQVLTNRRETDCRTAVTRGLAEYLSSLNVDAPGGRRLLFRRVVETWATPEVSAEYPAACVYSVEAGRYDASKLTPSVKKLVSGFALRASSELELPVVVDAWTTDPAERVAISGMLEDAFDPVDWMTGFRLELPHYHGARATFEAMTSRYVDEVDQAQRRLRLLSVSLTATVPKLASVGPAKTGVFRVAARVEGGGAQAPTRDGPLLLPGEKLVVGREDPSG